MATKCKKHDRMYCMDYNCRLAERRRDSNSDASASDVTTVDLTGFSPYGGDGGSTNTGDSGGTCGGGE